MNKNTKRLMFRRSMWRRRALTAAMDLVSMPAGHPNREQVERQVHRAINKVESWFRPPPRKGCCQCDPAARCSRI